MIHYKFIEKKVAYKIECDNCGFTANLDGAYKNKINDIFESSEFIVISHICGYGSRHFPDDTKLELHLCQDCWNKRLGDLLAQNMKEGYGG